MRLLPVVATVLLTAAAAYYLYIPLPDAIQEPWKLMMLDAGFRVTMHLVRGDVLYLLTVQQVCHVTDSWAWSVLLIYHLFIVSVVCSLCEMGEEMYVRKSKLQHVQTDTPLVLKCTWPLPLPSSESWVIHANTETPNSNILVSLLLSHRRRNHRVPQWLFMWSKVFTQHMMWYDKQSEIRYLEHASPVNCAPFYHMAGSLLMPILTQPN